MIGTLTITIKTKWWYVRFLELLVMFGYILKFIYGNRIIDPYLIVIRQIANRTIEYGVEFIEDNRYGEAIN